MTKKTVTLPGFRIAQRKNTKHAFFVFAAGAREVLSWSKVDRLAERKGGIQRRLIGAKVTAVQRFFELNKENTIPTSTVIAFGPGVAKFRVKRGGDNAAGGLQQGTLTFSYDPRGSEETRPAFVVDGQHRLHGMAKVDAEQLPMLVTALLDADANEQAFQFIVINNKASRVPPDLVKSLIVDFNEADLDRRLESARISLRGRAGLIAVVDDDPDSPLRGMVDWERRRGEGTPCVKPAAIDGSLAFARHRLLFLNDDDDATLDLFFNMWAGVRRAYPQFWDNVDNNLFKNAGFRAFNEYLIEEFDSLLGMDLVDVNKAGSVCETAERLASQIEIAFWTTPWQLKSLDTSAGRDLIKKDIRRIRANVREQVEWSEQVRVLGASPEE